MPARQQSICVISARNGCSVLVDGIRWVNESSASGVSSAVDLNTIPTSIIDHVEVLQDGASSIYGSDAIAGVVNIITRRSFDGLQFQAYGGAFDSGGGGTGQFSLSTGTKTDTLSAFIDLSYSRQNEISAASREITAVSDTGDRAVYRALQLGYAVGALPVHRSEHGRVSEYCHQLECDGHTALRFPASDTAPRTDDFHNFTVDDRFNFQTFNFIMTPSERYSVYAQGETKLTDRVSFYLKGLFNNRRSTNRAAPEPLFIGTEAGNGVGNLLDVTSISRLNPYNPFGFDLTEGYVVFRRPIEGGPRVFTQDVDTLYFSGGFRGDFLRRQYPCP